MQQWWPCFIQHPALDINVVLNDCMLVLMQSALYSCALDGDAGPVASGGGVTGCTSANLPEGYVTDETKELSHAKRHHVQ